MTDTPPAITRLVTAIAGAGGRPYIRQAQAAMGYRGFDLHAGRMAGLLSNAGLEAGARVALGPLGPVNLAAATVAAMATGRWAIILPAGLSAEAAQARTAAAAAGARISQDGQTVTLTRADGAEHRWPTENGALSEIEGIGSDGGGLVFQTSGTTGAPKGVRIGVHDLCRHLDLYREVLEYDVDSVLLNGLPLGHTDGLFHGPLVAAANGATLIRPPALSERTMDTWIRMWREGRPTHVITTPSLLRILLKLGGDRLQDLPKPRYVVSSAEHLDTDLWMQAEGTLGAPVVNIYGMTETVNGGLFAMPDAGDARIGTVGKPIGIETQIRPEAEGDVLWVRGDLASGYENGATFEPLPQDQGWFRTGDRVERRPDGLYRILGRVGAVEQRGIVLDRDAILEVAHTSDGVTGAKLVAIRFPEPRGEEAALFCVGGDTERLRAELREALPPLQVPRHLYNVTGDYLARLPTTVPIENLAAQGVRAGGTTSGPLALVLEEAVEAFGCRRSDLDARSTAETVRGWDSFAFVELILAVESRVGAQFEAEELSAIRTLDDLAALVAKRDPATPGAGAYGLPPDLPAPPEGLIFMNKTVADGIRQGLAQAEDIERIGARFIDRTVLDIGCGWGRMAYGLAARGVDGPYIGVDVLRPQIAWLRDHFTPARPGYAFHHIDIDNGLYNPGGSRATPDYAPFLNDRMAQTVMLLSVFTHMYRDDIATHLRAVRAVVEPGGEVYASCFLFDGIAAEGIAAGLAHRTFAHSLNAQTRYDQPNAPLAAIAYTEAAMREIAEDAGFSVRVRRGNWSHARGALPADLRHADGARFGQDIAICTAI